MDFRNPSLLCVAGSSSFVATLGPEDESVVPDLMYSSLVIGFIFCAVEVLYLLWHLDIHNSLSRLVTHLIS